MFKKTLTATVAALTLATASLSTAPAQAGSLGKVIAAGIVGAVVGSVIASKARSAPVDGAFEGGYRPVRGGYDGGCGFRPRPVFDEYGHQVGIRRVPAC